MLFQEMLGQECATYCSIETVEYSVSDQM